MTDYTQEEIDRLHNSLAGIYRRGSLTATEQVQVKGLWARIERLEAARVATIAKESAFLAAHTLGGKR